MDMVKNIIINNTDKCNAQVLYKSLELQTVNFIANRNAINKENVKCAKEKIKENLQFCIITPITVESVQKGCDN
jgi:hypothetical protein